MRILASPLTALALPGQDAGRDGWANRGGLSSPGVPCRILKCRKRSHAKGRSFHCHFERMTVRAVGTGIKNSPPEKDLLRSDGRAFANTSTPSSFYENRRRCPQVFCGDADRLLFVLAAHKIWPDSAAPSERRLPNKIRHRRTQPLLMRSCVSRSAFHDSSSYK